MPRAQILVLVVVLGGHGVVAAAAAAEDAAAAATSNPGCARPGDHQQEMMPLSLVLMLLLAAGVFALAVRTKQQQQQQQQQQQREEAHADAVSPKAATTSAASKQTMLQPRLHALRTNRREASQTVLATTFGLAKPLCASLSVLVQFAVRDFVQSWYANTSDDDEFLNDARLIMLDAAGGFLSLVLKLNVPLFLLSDVAPILRRHVKHFQEFRALAAEAHPDLFRDSNTDLDRFARRETALIEAGFRLHPGVSDKGRHARRVVNGILLALLAVEDASCQALVHLVREIIVFKIVYPCLNALHPYMLNAALQRQLQQSSSSSSNASMPPNATASSVATMDVIALPEPLQKQHEEEEEESTTTEGDDDDDEDGDEYNNGQLRSHMETSTLIEDFFQPTRPVDRKLASAKVLRTELSLDDVDSSSLLMSSSPSAGGVGGFFAAAPPSTPVIHSSSNTSASAGAGLNATPHTPAQVPPPPPKPFIAFVIEVKAVVDDARVETWIVSRRYRQFERLHDRLRAAYPSALLGTLPEKRGMKKLLVAEYDREFLEARARGLNQYLQCLVQDRYLRESHEMKQFLETDRPSPTNERSSIEGGGESAVESRGLGAGVGFKDEHDNMSTPQLSSIRVERHLYGLVDDIFLLKQGDRFSFLRRNMVSLVRLIVRGAFKGKVFSSIKEWSERKTDAVCGGVDQLRNAIWPNGMLAEPTAIPTDAAELERARRESLTFLQNALPAQAVRLIGASHAELVAQSSHEMIQYELLIKSLALEILDCLVDKLFPNLV